MEYLDESWTAQQLIEFMSLVSSFTDEASAVRAAIEHAAQALHACAGVAAGSGGVVAAVGFASGWRDGDPLAGLPRDYSGPVDVCGVGRCAMVSSPLDREIAGSLSLLLLRDAGDPFNQREIDLLRGLVSVLALALRSLRVLGAERTLRQRTQQQAQENSKLIDTLTQRQELLERLFKLQRAIVQRTDIDSVFAAVATGASEFLGVEVVELWLLEEDGAEDETMRVVASSVADTGTPTVSACAADPRSLSARVIEHRRVIFRERANPGADDPAAAPAKDYEWELAAPVFENGRVVGLLAARSQEPLRTELSGQETVLRSFAEHASLALTDAKNYGTALHRAFHDMLTGLPNRALFADRLEQAAARAVRGGARPAVLFFDLDEFKRVNDSLGHAAGDELLVEVGRRLGASIRPTDTAARFGGDEFAVLLEAITDESEATDVAKRIMADLSAPFVVGGKRVTIGISIGIATLREMGDDLLRNADLAMYQAKARGRDTFEVFEPAMHATLVERLRLEADLERAVAEEEFEVVYQPIVDLSDGAVVAVEALVRWRHPERGLLAPATFIAAAEETGLIRAIGAQVLRVACAQGASWQRSHPSAAPLAVSVNLSVHQLHHPELLREVSEVLTTSGLNPESLILEITETVLMQDLERGMLTRLKQLGVKIAVDDFGTGYSSLQYLQGFPIDILKIDRSFMGGVDDPSDLTLAQAVIDIGDGLELCVIAEGVEEAEQANRLLDRGCHLGQGFHYSRPQPPAELESLLTRNGVRGWEQATPAARGGRRAALEAAASH
jgi:diguanylate cyclase (GGDEF)-like protein